MLLRGRGQGVSGKSIQSAKALEVRPHSLCARARARAPAHGTCVPHLRAYACLRAHARARARGGGAEERICIVKVWTNVRTRAQVDPTICATGFARARFYLFSRREPSDGAEARDVLNEKPQNEFLAAAATAKTRLAASPPRPRLHYRLLTLCPAAY